MERGSPPETTFGEDEGYSAGRPASPAETKKLAPPCAKWLSYERSLENSGAPQLFETYWACVLA